LRIQAKASGTIKKKMYKELMEHEVEAFDLRYRIGWWTSG
jgi:hypothetical protein